MTEMSPAEAIFFAAAALPTSERASYVAQVCAGRDDLRQRVEQMLAAQPLVGSFLESPAKAGEATSTHAADRLPERRDYDDPTACVGAILAGKYKLIEEIGEGGMGSVYMAQQTEPVKRAVAVKVIKAGMDSKAVLARFGAERQALALMDHPNIAKVLDAGTTESGRPFFVMELVKGVTITQYCDERKLTPRQRLELFVPVCLAIQHAHQKGVIHRDIKPSNVLVALYDDRPVPKVIDFGVAKAAGQVLTDRTLMTGFGALVGTPEYMSPEQANLNNLDIDTRSDVYSLGVLLYELLTGSTPVDRKSLGMAGMLEILRIVREVEAPRPSAKLSTIDTLASVAACRGTEPAKLSKLMKGELDWVLLKALEKDRSRRYETANALSRDIQRYLADEVVEARPPSTGYRLKKFVRRNKGQVIAGSLVLCALVVGIAGTTLGLVEAKRQEAEARRQEQEANRQKQLAQEEAAEKEKARLAEIEQRNLAQGRADDLKYQLGVSNMVLASAAYDSRDYKLTAERLDKVPVEQRGWEWRYLKRQLNGGIFTLHGLGGFVTSVAFSPDGTRIVTGFGDQPFQAKVWDAATGVYLFDLKGLSRQLNAMNSIAPTSMAFSADSKRILTFGGDNTARVCDATTGALQLELKDVKCAAFNPDGTQIATTSWAGGSGFVKLSDARTGKTLLEWRADKSNDTRVAFSPDGSRILTVGRAVKVWETQTGKLLLDAKATIGPFASLASSPDSKRIVVGRKDGTAQVLDAETGAVLLELKGRPRTANPVTLSIYEGVQCVAFSPDGARIVTGGTSGDYGTFGLVTGEASVWDARTGAELVELKGHNGIMMSAAFSPDGQQIITGSLDGTAKVWDARTGTPRLQLEANKNSILCALFSPDGTWMVSGAGVGEPTIWDARTGRPKFTLKGLKGRVNCVAISKDGNRIATGCAEGSDKPGQATVWDARTGQPLFELMGLKEGVTSLAFSPDGERIITGGEMNDVQGNEVKVWDGRTGTLLLDLTQAHPGGIRIAARVGVAFSPDGKRVVVAGARSTTEGGGVATVRDAQTGAALVELKAPKDTPLSVAFSPDGTRIAVAHFTNSVTVWDAEKGTPLLDLKGHTGSVGSVAFSPDGKRIVTGSGDRTVRVWDARTGVTLLEFKGHTHAVTSVSFSADGSRILTAGGEVFVWDARLRTHEGEPDEEELAYRRLHTQPNPSRYRAGYLASRAAKDDFAAAFYLNLIPPDERKDLLAQADADASAALSKLAEEYVRARKEEEAVPLLMEVLRVNTAKLGPKDPTTIEIAEHLGNIYLRLDQFDKAVPLLEDVVKYRKAKLGSENSPVNAMRGLALAYNGARRFPELIAVLEEEGAKHPRFMAMLLDAYELVGEHAKVIARCQKQLAEDRKSRPNADPNVDLLARLGRAYLAQKKSSEAEPHLRECLAIHEKEQPDDWSTFDAQSLLGGALLGQKKYAEAEPQLLKGYEGMKAREKSIPPQANTRIPEALDRLIELYTATDKPDEAKKWRAERAKYPDVPPPPREKK